MVKSLATRQRIDRAAIRAWKPTLDLYCTTCWIVHPLGIDVYDFHDAGAHHVSGSAIRAQMVGLSKGSAGHLFFAMAGLQVDGKGEA